VYTLAKLYGAGNSAHRGWRPAVACFHPLVVADWRGRPTVRDAVRGGSPLALPFSGVILRKEVELGIVYLYSCLCLLKHAMENPLL
jgi:hypothetical protein